MSRTESPIEDIKRRIAALANMTVANGATEHEAMAAAKLVAKLLLEYNLSLDEVTANKQEYGQGSLYTGYRIKMPHSICMAAIADLTGCHAWFKKQNGVITYKFFGSLSDKSLAVYLATVVHRALHTESDKFKNTPTYFNSDNRRSAFKSFQHGFAKRITQRINAMKNANDVAMCNASTSTSLVLFDKADLAREKMAEAGRKIIPYGKKKVKVVDEMAYGSGMIAGDAVSLNIGVEDESYTPIKRIG